MKTKLKNAIEDLLVTALEGGSNYWYFLPLENIDEIKKCKGISTSEKIADFILNGGTVDVYDTENEDEKLGEINLTSIEKAFNIMHDNWSTMYGEILNGDCDGDSADVWFQLSTMGEVVFG